MNRIETGYCSACRRRHPRYQAVPDFPQPTNRELLRETWKFLVGMVVVYLFLALLFAMGAPNV